MRSYGQFCPVARASEILAERWTPIILRNLLNGATTYSAIAADAPGIPRSLLTARLRHLAHTGVLTIRPNPSGRGSRYELTGAGRALGGVLHAMGTWADEWLELHPEHVDPGTVLHHWVQHCLALDQLPGRRVVVRFDFPEQPVRTRQLWLIFDGERSEVCRTMPGFDEDAVVTTSAMALADWHRGHLEWNAALRTRRIEVTGPTAISRSIPRWNTRETRLRPPAVA